MKRASSEALEDDLCATCGHYHARGTTCDECGHVRRGEEDAGASASSGTEGPLMTTTMREPSPQEVARRTCPVEIFERFLLVGSFEHTASERDLALAGVRTVINAAPRCHPCCSGKYLSVVSLTPTEEGGERLDLRHACERLQSLHVRSERSDSMHPVRVLVYCMSGRSRAPSVAVAYVMFKLRMRLEDAKTFVASKYPRGHRGIMWKEGDLDALKEFERELAENPPDRLPE